MDPNANLHEQEELLLYGSPQLTKARLRALRRTLTHWLQRGGFAPDWSKCPNAAKYFGK